MSTPTHGVETSPGAGEAPAPKKKVNPVLFLLLVPIMLLRKGQQALSKAVYSGFAGGFRQCLGVVFGLAAGIGTGYALGWVQGASTAAWLSSGVGVLLVTYWYLWPLLYLGVVKQLFRLAETLWETVQREDDHSWFSALLKGIAYIATVLACLYLGWDVFVGTKAHVAANWGWFTWLAWPAGIVSGILVALIAGAISWALVKWVEMPFIAVVSGVGITYALAERTAGYLTPLLTGFGLPANLIWVAYLAEFGIFVAYLFPLVHVFMTHAFGRLMRWVGRLPEKVYGDSEERSEYRRRFFAQVVNLGAAYGLTALSLKLAAIMTLSLPLTLTVAALVAILSYTLVGKLLREEGNRLVGFAAAAGAALQTFFFYRGAELWFGIYGAIGAAAVAAALTYRFLFPLAYVIVRFITQLTRVSLLGTPLTWVHDQVFNGLDRLATEIGHAFDNTYDDSTAYRDLFLQIANVAATVGLVYGTLKLSAALGFALWLTYGLASLVLAVSYIAGGKLLLKAGNSLVGVLVALAAGVAAGAFGYAHLPSGWWWIALAVAIGLAGALVTGLLLFPVAYVLLRWPLNAILTPWLRPILVGIHTFAWERCAAVWQQIADTYRAVEAWFSPIWASFLQTWNDTWDSVKETWERMTGGSR